MDVIEILKDKSIKKLQARELIVRAIADGSFSLREFESRLGELNEKQIATVLEAIEEITGKKIKPLGAEYLLFAQRFILSENNSCKREASRIVGNMAADHPDLSDDAVAALLQNAQNDGTVVRWSSAYALSRIIVLERYRGSSLVDTVRGIYEAEEESGVRNQYKKALKRIKAI